MPALRLFGRAWLIACDDLVAPAALGVLVRGSWLGVLLAFAYAYEGDALACPVAQCDWMLGLGCLWGYAAGSIVLVGSSAVLEVALNSSAVALMSASARGTPMQPEARRGVAPLLYMHIAVSLCEAAWAGWATPVFLSPSFSCGDETKEDLAAIRVITDMVYLSLGSLAALLLGCLVSFDLFGSVNVHHIEELNKHWEAKCWWMCCLARPHIREDGRVALRSVGTSMATLFAGLDLAPSDAVVALLLLTLHEAHPAP
ncbi:hypothetical protein T484DRAFT_1825074 [Baffinella frigidus]|nr:hypothetical protein T484DRAFT_1825074 [Cryptophyta sp. CCMP2293]